MASLAQYGEVEISAWHGIGKNAMEAIREALECYEVSPKIILTHWLEVFNWADAHAALYAENAVNHQVATEPVTGRDAINALGSGCKPRRHSGKAGSCQTIHDLEICP